MTIQTLSWLRVTCLALFSMASLIAATTAERDLVFVGSSTMSIWRDGVGTTKFWPFVATPSKPFTYTVGSVAQSGTKIPYFNDAARLKSISDMNPKMIVFYVGGNDIEGGDSTEVIANNYRAFVNNVRKNSKRTDLLIAWLEQNPSPSRWGSKDKQIALNTRVKADISKASNEIFIPSWDDWLLGGTPNKGLYSDGLHHNAAGYNILVNQVRPFVDNFFTSSTPSVPNPPSGLSATATSATSINLSWTDTSNNETGFKIARSTTLGGTYSLIHTTAANATSFSNTGLTAATQYFYKVSATNTTGDSVAVTANATTPSASAGLAPTAPSSLLATVISANSIDLSWTDTSNNETGFKITRSLTSGGTYVPITTTAANATTFSDTGLIAATQYFYKVSAINTTGDSVTVTANATTSNGGTTPIIPAADSGSSSKCGLGGGLATLITLLAACARLCLTEIRTKRVMFSSTFRK